MSQQNVRGSRKSITRTGDDKVSQLIHWRVCKTWYDHTPDPVLESENTKISWDFLKFKQIWRGGKEA